MLSRIAWGLFYRPDWFCTHKDSFTFNTRVLELKEHASMPGFSQIFDYINIPIIILR